MISIKSGSKDPRPLLRSRAGFDPSAQPDQRQFLNDTAARIGNTISLADAGALVRETPANQLRNHCEYSPYYFDGSFGLGAVFYKLLIPRNPNRSSFVVINNSLNALLMIFGPPPGPAGGVDPATLALGFWVQPFSFFQEKNGSCNVGDITISNGVLNPFPFHVIGYEGTPPIGEDQ